MKIESLLTALALAVCINPPLCNAGLMHAGASDTAHIALGVANSADVLWVESEYQGTFFYFSAIRLNQQYAITAAHAVYIDPVTPIIVPRRVGDGTHRISDPGNVRAVSEVTVYPSFQGVAITRFTVPDVAILKFSEPLPGDDPEFASANSVNTGDIVTTAGFGAHGFTNGVFSMDGSIRGWNARILSESTGGHFDKQNYGDTHFNPSIGVSLNGRYANGDSGSPVYHSSGALIGMTIGGTPGTLSTQETGSTIFLDFTNSVTRAWVETNTAIPPTADPPLIALSVDTACRLSLTRLTANREYRLMRSEILSGWIEATRFTATSSTENWTEALAPGGRMFYRLEWDE